MVEPNPWAPVIGPCYRAISLVREVGWSPQQVTVAAASLRVLELETEDNVLLYPALQIWEGRVVAGLNEVLLVLSSGTGSRWTWAQWLNSPVDETGEPAPNAIEQLRAGQLDSVLLDAGHAAPAWRR